MQDIVIINVKKIVILIWLGESWKRYFLNKLKANIKIKKIAKWLPITFNKSISSNIPYINDIKKIE